MLTGILIRSQIRSNIRRPVKKRIAAERHSSTTNESLSPDILFNEEHKKQVLKCMQSAPPVGLRMQSPKKESGYAAVLIALCTNSKATSQCQEQEVSILYTRRSVRLSRHVRQVSFPGGLQDHTDNDYIDCALRETEEEIGLPRNRVEIWGCGALIRPPHTAAIMPVIGVVRDFDIEELTLNEDEVEDAFTVSLKDLIKPGILQHTQFKSGFSSPVFMVQPYKIWGITGFLTNTFLHCLLPDNVFQQRVKFLRPFKTEKPKLNHIND